MHCSNNGAVPSMDWLPYSSEHMQNDACAQLQLECCEIPGLATWSSQLTVTDHPTVAANCISRRSSSAVLRPKHDVASSALPAQFVFLQNAELHPRIGYIFGSSSQFSSPGRLLLPARC